MSSAYVREAFYAALPKELPDYVFVPTLNVWSEQKDLPPGGWYSIDFVSVECLRTSLGSPGCFRERGSAVITLAAPAMAGDINLARQADVVWWRFQDWYDPGGLVHVQQANPPIEVDAGDLRGAWWLFEVPLEYVYHHVGPNRSTGEPEPPLPTVQPILPLPDPPAPFEPPPLPPGPLPPEPPEPPEPPVEPLAVGEVIS